MKRHFLLNLAALTALLALTQGKTPEGGASAGGSSGKSAQLAAVTKENPWVNSLGMKFVPVPGTKVLFCTTETTRDQYILCGRGYQAPGFAQDGNHPAVNVSWEDAKAFCAWLSKRDGVRYRLPTDHEWSCAVGIGHLENASASPEAKDGKLPGFYPWGQSWPPPNHVGNYLGQEMRGCTPAERALLFKGFTLIGGFSDRHKFTAPVGAIRPTAWASTT